jgi:hypothetical protein
MRDVGENSFLEQLGEDRRTLRSTRWAESTTFTRESDEKLIAALRTHEAGETGFEESALKVAEDGAVPEGSSEAVASLESFLPQALEVLEVGIEKLIEGGGLWLSRPVDRRRCRFRKHQPHAG